MSCCIMFSHVHLKLFTLSQQSAKRSWLYTNKKILVAKGKIFVDVRQSGYGSNSTEGKQLTCSGHVCLRGQLMLTKQARINFMIQNIDNIL